MAFSTLSGTLLALSLVVSTIAQECATICQSFGTDFMSNGAYFQNIQSSENFTALQEFEGCQSDSTYNILVDPEGNQVECNRTPMQPDDTPQLVTCPIQKDQLVSGSWSMIVISNNGQCDPIDYVRSFSLSVGEQSTTTVPVTISVTSTSTPVESHTTTQTSVITSTADPSTTTVQNPPAATLTFYPLPSIDVVTRGILTLTSATVVPNVVATSTIISTEACGDLRAMALEAAATPSSRREVPDTRNSISITLADIVEKLAQQTSAPTKREALSGPVAAKRAMNEARSIVQVRQILRNRAPDAPTTTITDSSSSVTETSTGYAATTTVTGTTTLIQTSTTTPTVTVRLGGGGVTTTWAPAKTITNVFWVPVREVFATITQEVTLTVTQTATAAC